MKRPPAADQTARPSRALFAIARRADSDRIKHNGFPPFVRGLARNLLCLENRFRDGAEVEEQARDEFREGGSFDR